MSVLKIKDQNGNWIQIPTIKGEDGQDYVLTENDKQEIAGLVDAPVEDVQINRTSIVSDGVANIPVGSQETLGVVKAGTTYGTQTSGGQIRIYKAESSNIKIASGDYKPIVPSTQHEATFYGLAKAAGDVTQLASSNAVGTYTDDAKSAIKTMLGVEDPIVDDVQIDGTSITINGVANIPIATATKAGAVKVDGYGLQMQTNKIISVKPATTTQIKEGLRSWESIVPGTQHRSVFYGLAKAAGDTTQSESDNAVGTYTDDAKEAIQSMIGIDYPVADVQVKGTSIINNGVAEIPVASLNTRGITKAGNGLYTTGEGDIRVEYAGSATIKTATNSFNPITPKYQHESTFYGLAKSAGDTTQSQSANEVGTYTDEAKTAIKQMLDIKDDYDSLVVEVSGTDPVITGKPSYRYNCGELYTLTVTPPASGTIDIIFTSGTTPTVLSLPNTVKMPDWWAGIETNTTYEMCITDGTYCGVMSWAT